MLAGVNSKGSIAAVVFDWAGTIVDFGCFAPTVSIVETFAERGIQITLAEARGPMGLEKKEHLRRLLDQEGVRRQWRNGDRFRSQADGCGGPLRGPGAEALSRP